MASLLTIFLIFLRLGALTFGGGLAMIPIIKKEILRRGWATDEEINDYIAVAQVAPGMVAINIAVLIGNHIRGRKGSLVAVLGVALPSLVIIIIIAALLKQFADIQLVQYAISGILMSVVILLISAMIDIGKTAIKNYGLLIYALIGFSLVFFLNVNSILVILSAFVLGSIHSYITYRKQVKKDA
jgi:chromate transporter